MKETFPLLVFPAWRGGWPLIFPAAVCLALGTYLLLRPPRRNPWVGARVPWTYADEEIWNKSQRLTTWLVLAMGVGFLLWWPLGVAAVIALAAGAILYARRLYVAKYGTSKTWHGGEGLIDYRPMARCANCGALNPLQSADDLPLARCAICRYPLDRRDR